MSQITQLFQKEPVQNTFREPVQNSVPNWFADFDESIVKHRSDTNLAFPVAPRKGEQKAFQTGSRGQSTASESQFRTKVFRTGSRAFRTGSKRSELARSKLARGFDDLPEIFMLI